MVSWEASREAKWPPAQAEIGVLRPGQDDGTGDDGHGANHQPPVNVLLEHHPGHDQGQDVLQVQQQ